MGVEEVEAAANWFQDQIAKNPHMPLRQTMISQADPMSYVLTSYQQAQKVQAIASGDYSQIVAELQKAGFNISKADTPTATAPAAPVTPQVAATPATPATTAPAAPKRSKLASSGGSTLAAPSEVSMIDAVFRR